MFCASPDGTDDAQGDMRILAGQRLAIRKTHSAAELERMSSLACGCLTSPFGELEIVNFKTSCPQRNLAEKSTSQIGEIIACSSQLCSRKECHGLYPLCLTKSNVIVAPKNIGSSIDEHDSPQFESPRPNNQPLSTGSRTMTSSSQGGAPLK